MPEDKPIKIREKDFGNPTKDNPVRVKRMLEELTTLSKDPARRDEFLAQLNTSELDIDYVDLLVKFGIVSRPVGDHLQADWFGKGDGSKGKWFADDQPIKPKFRENMRRAFELAQAYNLPVVVYWIVPAAHVYVTY